MMAFLFAGGFVYSGQDARAETAGDIQKDIDKLNKKYKETEAELATLNSQLYKNQAQINIAAALVKKLQDDILRREAEMDNLNARAKLNKDMLGEYIRKLYYADQENGVVQLAVFNGGLNDLAADPDGMVEIKEKIMETLQAIEISKGETEEAKSELADRKQDHQEILQEKKEERGEIAADISETKATLAELQKKIAELRSALSSFLGKDYSTKDIDDAVKFASKATGVRREFIQAELIVETGYGTFTGGCAYKNIRMKKADVAEFLKITAELEKAYGGNYKDKKLSCSPKWGGYGGAMGVAQFMPTTWIGYKTKISAKTGSNPADPWDLADGITGMAIKLAAGGATSKSGEYLASKRYYCGGPSSPYWKTKCEDYAKKVQYFSKDPESHI